MSESLKWPKQAGSVSQILDLRDRLIREVFSDYAALAPRGDLYRQLCSDIARFLRVKSSRVIQESLTDILGKQLNDRTIKATAWRLAAGASRLRRGRLVPVWSGQTAKEHVQVQFVDCRFQSRRGRPSAVFSLVILNGTPAGREIRTWYTTDFCMMLGRRLGYTSIRHGFPMRSYRELVGLRMAVLLEPEYSTAQAPGFRHVKGTPSAIKWNKTIIGLRFRTYCGKRWHCPKNHQWACFECPVSYSECPASVRKEPINVSVSTNDAARSCS